jgi:hypothetical protein
MQNIATVKSMNIDAGVLPRKASSGVYLSSLQHIGHLYHLLNHFSRLYAFSFAASFEPATDAWAHSTE